MSLENPTFESKPESTLRADICIEPDYDSFIPEGFRDSPVEYFEKTGQNIKSGEIQHGESGRVREDPTAVKKLPPWIDKDGKELQVVGKRVDIKKGKVGESGDPFYEYGIMKVVNDIGLPVAKPIAKVEHNNVHLMIMEEIDGIGWYDRGALGLKEKGYSDADIEDLKNQAEAQMEELAKLFEAAGIIRGWKLKDMIFDIDIENKKVRKIIPTDWERTRIDFQRLEEYKKLHDVT